MGDGGGVVKPIARTASAAKNRGYETLSAISETSHVDLKALSLGFWDLIDFSRLTSYDIYFYLI
jgi:hypothetical protein